LQRPLANVLRAGLALGWWALAMTAWSTSQDSGVKEAFQVVLKIWACITLFMTANLLKTLLAKMLSSKFNKESHIQKIQDSLVKEYHLHMLLQPRNRFGGNTGEGGAADNFDFSSSSPYNGGAGGVDGGKMGGMHAVHDVHASCGTAVGNFGDSLVSSVVRIIFFIFCFFFLAVQQLFFRLDNQIQFIFSFFCAAWSDK
jgi:hypothetical protein